MPSGMNELDDILHMFNIVCYEYTPSRFGPSFSVFGSQNKKMKSLCEMLRQLKTYSITSQDKSNYGDYYLVHADSAVHPEAVGLHQAVHLFKANTGSTVAAGAGAGVNLWTAHLEDEFGNLQNSAAIPASIIMQRAEESKLADYGTPPGEIGMSLARNRLLLSWQYLNEACTWIDTSTDAPLLTDNRQFNTIPVSWNGVEYNGIWLTERCMRELAK